MTEVYTSDRGFATANPPEPGGVGPRSVIQAAKEAVPVIDLADRLCGPRGLRRGGGEWVGRCPLPDHEDRSPSFTANPDKNVWFCHGCARGGDVVTLAQLAWDHTRADVAAADLLLEFGHEIPPRPAAWYAKHTRQEPVRAALEAAKVRRVQRRLYRWLFAPIVARSDDPLERLEEAERAWEEAGRIAFMLVRRSREEV